MKLLFSLFLTALSPFNCKAFYAPPTQGECFLRINKASVCDGNIPFYIRTEPEIKIKWKLEKLIEQKKRLLNLEKNFQTTFLDTLELIEASSIKPNYSKLSGEKINFASKEVLNNGTIIQKTISIDAKDALRLCLSNIINKEHDFRIQANKKKIGKIL